MEDWKNKSLGYKVGYVCGLTCVLSLVVLATSLIVIGTGKLIFWFLTL